jgi:hypothetical protein
LSGRSGEEDRQQVKQAPLHHDTNNLGFLLNYLRSENATPALLGAVESLYRFISSFKTSGATASDLLVRAPTLSLFLLLLPDRKVWQLFLLVPW